MARPLSLAPHLCDSQVRKLFDKEKGKRKNEKLQISRTLLMDVCRKEYEEDCDELLDHGVAEIFDASSLAYLYDM